MADWKMDEGDLNTLAEFCRAASRRYADHAEELRKGGTGVYEHLAVQFDEQKAEALAFAEKLDRAASASVVLDDVEDDVDEDTVMAPKR